MNKRDRFDYDIYQNVNNVMGTFVILFLYFSRILENWKHVGLIYLEATAFLIIYAFVFICAKVRIDKNPDILKEGLSEDYKKDMACLEENLTTGQRMIRWLKSKLSRKGGKA